MAVSTAIKSQGTTIKIDVAIQGTPDTEIANVRSFSGFDGEASEIDITHLGSTAKEFTAGLLDYGGFSMEFDVDLSDVGQDDLRSAALSGATKTFLITYPDASTATFTAIVKNADSQQGGVDDVIKGSASLKITGAVTYA